MLREWAKTNSRALSGNAVTAAPVRVVK
jgi:hypothetical protein